MLISELIRYLQQQKEEFGDIVVCVYNPHQDFPCESIVAIMYKDTDYLNWCEDKIKNGDFITLS